jgi:L-asparaginase II
MTVSSPLAITIDVPHGDFAGDVPLVAVMRGGYVGSLHRGSFVAVDSSGRVVLSAGDIDQPVFLRSAAKPFQAMPAVLSGAIDRFGLTDEEVAVLCASHHAERRHMEVILGVLRKAGLDESALRCGVHPPIDPESAADLVRRGADPSPVCNNCSGAHTGMLLACVANGWTLDSYGDPAHPLQQLTVKVLAAFADVSPDDIELATDNCVVPTFRLPLRAAALAFSRLVTGVGVDPEYVAAATRLTSAMTAQPRMVSGAAGFDTALMRAGRGEIVCKGGAEAFQGVALRGTGLGIAAKISDGDARALPPAMLAVLDALDAFEGDTADDLQAFRRPVVLSAAGEPVGEIEPVFSIEAGA